MCQKADMDTFGLDYCHVPFEPSSILCLYIVVSTSFLLFRYAFVIPFCLFSTSDLSSVDVLFFGMRKCVPGRTFLLFLAHEFLRRLSYKNERHMHVLCSSTWLLGSHGGACSDAHPSHPPHIATHHIHQYQVDIRWVSVPSRRFCGTT